MQAIESDPIAAKALAIYCNHGYAADGVQKADAVPQVWRWCADGWTDKPHPAVPDNVKGYRAYGKSCWMTETSGEKTQWLAPSDSFPKDGAFSIALKIHQALAEGNVSAWLYWQTVSDDQVGGGALTDGTLKENSPKFAAARHYFKYIRPGARRIDAAIADAPNLNATAFVHDTDRTLTVVLLNLSPTESTVHLKLPAGFAPTAELKTFTSSDKHLWQTADAAPPAPITVPGYGIVTVLARR